MSAPKLDLGGIKVFYDGERNRMTPGRKAALRKISETLRESFGQELHSIFINPDQERDGIFSITFKMRWMG